MDVVCLSLGHNSSAILIRDGKILGGYETERFTRVKSDSIFPSLAIAELHRRFTIAEDVEFMVGHWALDGDLISMSMKHWNPSFIKSLWPKSKVQSLGSNFTHHDSHAYSGLSFAGDTFPTDESYVLVMDGFGTFGEHTSVYKIYAGIPVLQWRKFGFGSSMGLFYQFTTGYLGMKQNQDEYKLLAYESYIEEAKNYIEGKKLDIQIRKWTEYFSDQMDRFDTAIQTDPMASIGALPYFAKIVNDIHGSVLKELGVVDLSDRLTKIIISYFTQSVVEGVVSHIVRMFNPKNVILVGGLFYNVKINSMISRLVKGKLCIMPLAGDQGAALGIYHAKYGLKWPGHVYWGHRDLFLAKMMMLPKGVIVIKDDNEAMQLAADVIRKQGSVNIVRGAMEFGPRALCHTSTLAVANQGIGPTINTMNGRVNEMPFAPVISPGKAENTFEETAKIWKSLEYMIVTRDYKEDVGNTHKDAAHLDVNRGVYTGRPQITNDPEIVTLLRDHELLINTSFNFHGVPIVNGVVDAVDTHNFECNLAGKNPLPTTIIVTGDVK